MTRVLLVRLSAMGDVVQSLGAVLALHRARPELELAFVTQSAHAPLLAGFPGVRHVVLHDRGGGLRAFAATRRALRELRCDTAIDLQGNWKSAFTARLSGARDRIGAAAPWRQEPASRVLLTRTVPVPGPNHPALVARTLVRALAPDAPDLAPSLAATETEIDGERAAVAALGLDPSRPFRVVVAGATKDPRAQRPDALLVELAASPFPVLLLAGPAEERFAPPPGVPFLRHRRGELRRLVALGALAARAGGDCVGPDQGALHVLAACGLPATALFGPQDPVATAPPGARVLRHRAPPACAPCRRAHCRHPAGPVCMAFSSSEGVEAPPPAWREAERTAAKRPAREV